MYSTWCPINFGILVVLEKKAYVVERFGKFLRLLSPCFHFLIPFVDKVAYAHSLKEKVISIPDQTTITKDNLAQTTMHSELGKITLDKTLGDRDELNEKIMRDIDEAAKNGSLSALDMKLGSYYHIME
ncbi:hypothetical protein CRYUN_Cryun14cG0061500 [Craigia yunnanensis]